MPLVTFTRRVFILIVFTAFLINLVLLAMVKHEAGGTKAGRPSRHTLIIQLDGEGQATQVLEKLQRIGLEVSMTKKEGFKRVPQGYVVVQDHYKKEILESIAKTLEYKGYRTSISASPNEGQSRCQVGRVYSSKSEAEDLAKKIFRELKMNFSIEQHYKKVPGLVSFVEVRGLDKNMVGKLKAELKSQASEIKEVSQ